MALEQRSLGAAAIIGVWAARIEGTAGRRIEGRRQFASQANALAAIFGPRRRRRGKKRPRIGVLRFGIEHVLGRDLDRPAEIHDHHPVRHMFHHRQVVADEDIGEVQPLLEIGEKIEDLRLDRDVEGRDRLVENEDLRLQHERAGDRDALALAAREHMRISPIMFRPQANLGKHRFGFRPPFCSRQLGVDLQRLFQDRADLLAWIESAIGILEDDLDDRAQAFGIASGAARRDRHAIDDELAFARGFDHRQDAGEGRLSAPRFPDNGEGLALLNRETRLLDGLELERLGEHPAFDFVDLAEILGGDDRVHAASPTASRG